MIVMMLVLVVVVVMVAMPMIVMMLVLVVVVVMVAMAMPVVMLLPIEVTVEVVHVMVMRLMHLVEDYVEVAALDAGRQLARHGNLEAIDVQARQRSPQAILVGTKVEQRADNHVATDATRTLQIQRLARSHCYSSSMWAPRAPT